MTSEDVERELEQARRHVDDLLDAIRRFPERQAAEPWLYLEELLRDLRAAVVTTRALEDLVAAYLE